MGCLSLDPRYYESMLHFFRSLAFDLRNIKSKWQDIILAYIEPVEIDGYIVTIGDHIKVAKEARRMPGVKKLHQDSENVGKSEYIFGHQFGMAGILAKGKTMQCIPVDIELQDGINEIERLRETVPSISQTQDKTNKDNTSISKMIQMTANFVKLKSQKAIILLDAFFASGDAFNSIEKDDNDIILIMRGKSNTVAFENPEEPKKRGRGRPRKYGKKIQLREFFDKAIDTFTAVTINLYGKDETVKYLCKDLIWKPIGRKLRFVLVKTNGKKMILICSDLSMAPEKIILAYSYRFKIEVSFKMLKQVLGGFFYHFWTTAMPKLSRFKTNSNLSCVTRKEDKEKIISTMRAIEVYTFIGCIAMGILSIVSINFKELVWSKFFGWLRTRSSENPSIETVRSVLRQELWKNIYNLNRYATLSNIHRYQKPRKRRFHKDAA